MATIEILPFAAATAIGLLVGFERERSHRGAARERAGSRTFALVGLCGALSAAAGAITVAAGMLTVGAFVLAFVRPRTEEDPGITTAMAVLTTFLLGSLAWTDEGLAVALAVIVTVLLMAKRQIHAFARDVITAVELEDALTFGIIAFVILPLLPDRALGPYGALNPHRIWLAVVAFTTISWLGYIAVRAVGPRRGSAVVGFAGGFVSATATTATMARRRREGEELSVTVAAALLASVATFVQLVGVLAVVDRELAWQLLPACVLGAAVLVLLGVFGLRSRRGDPGRSPVEVSTPSAPAETPIAGNSASRSSVGQTHPFSLRAAFLFATVLTLASLIGGWAADLVGDGAAVLVAGLTGLADAHAGALAAASMSMEGDLPASTAALAVGAAVAGNMIVKVVISFSIGGRGFGVRFAAAVVPAAAVFVLFAALSG